MPPKGAKKAKETTPEPKVKVKSEAKATPTKTSTPKKLKAPVVFNSITKSGNAALLIDASYEGGAAEAKQTKAGGYTHTIKLDSPHAFSIVKTFVFTDDPELNGQQAIVIRPAKPFEFMKLTKEVRIRVYRFYFAQKGVVGEAIPLDGKRTGKENKDLYAKTYAEGSKNRVGLLATCKEVNAEATPILYAHTLKFESTTTLQDFLCQADTSTKNLLTTLHINSYVKTTSRNVMSLLADVSGICSLRIDTGIYTEGDPEKAVKSFWGDANKFLDAMGRRMVEKGGSKADALEVLTFGKQAFTFKDDKKNAKPWSDYMVEEFKDLLKEKLK